MSCEEALTKYAGKVEYDDVITRQRGFNYVNSVTWITQSASGAITTLTPYNLLIAGSTAAPYPDQLNPFFIRRRHGVVKIDGLLTTAGQGTPITAVASGGSGSTVTGGTQWVSLFSITNTSGTEVSQRQLFPLVGRTITAGGVVVGWGTAYFASKPMKTGASSTTSSAFLQAGVSATSLFGHNAVVGASANSAIMYPTIARVLVSGSVAYCQVFLPTQAVIVGLNSNTVLTRLPKIFISGLEYPCIDPRPNNTL